MNDQQCHTYVTRGHERVNRNNNIIIVNNNIIMSFQDEDVRVMNKKIK